MSGLGNELAHCNVRYLVDDVEESIDFYTKHLGFNLLSIAAPAFADVERGVLKEAAPVIGSGLDVDRANTFDVAVGIEQGNVRCA